MMARKREDRQRDWDETIRDIEAVMQGRGIASRAVLAPPPEENKKASHKMTMVIALVVIFLGAIAFLVLR